MKFILTRYPTDDGPGVFAAFADGTQLLLGDPRGDLTPEIHRTWAAAVLAHLFGPEIAGQLADRLAASDLMAPDLQQSIDWESEQLVLHQADVVLFVVEQLVLGELNFKLDLSRPWLPEAAQLLGRTIDQLPVTPGMLAVQFAFERVVENFRRAGDTAQEAVSDLSLSFAELAHDLQATRNERDAAICEAFEQSLNFEERQAVERIRAGKRDISDMGILIERVLWMLKVRW